VPTENPFDSLCIATEYAQGRLPLGIEALKYIHGLLPERKTGKALDLGVGTGLSSFGIGLPGAGARGENPGWQIIGLDASLPMLRRCQDPRILRIKGDAHHMPLQGGIFDFALLIRFFHWIDPDLMLPELFRVLRPGGVVIVVNQDERSTMVDESRAILKQFNFEPKKSSRKAGMNVPASLERHGFNEVTAWEQATEELYGRITLRSYLASVSWWDGVEKTAIPPMLNALMGHFGRQFQGSHFHRPITNKVVSAVRP